MKEIFLWNILTFVLGAIVAGIVLYLRTYLKRHAENASQHAWYPARYSEQTHSRWAEYREQVLFEKFEGIISVHVRLCELIAEFERRLPALPEAEEMERELKSVASEMRSIGRRLYVHSGFHDKDISNEMVRVVKRLRDLAAATENLASEIHIQDKTQEEFFKESLAILKDNLNNFEVDLTNMAKTLKDAATPQALVRKDRKKLK